jgi:YidC/Oxa1 family membrane protein insertase
LEFLGIIWESFWHLLLNILVAINSVVNFPAVSIIIFTLFMRLLTVPLTMKALKSSRNMQQIQPLMKEIQKKHGKDKAKQQEEMMKLYREYNINPAAGCFPMLVQLPIFIGLFSALQFTLPHYTGTEAEIATQTAAHLAQLRDILWSDSWVNSAANFSQPFLWVPSLASADPFFIWPVLSGLFQFIQSRMAMPLRDPNNPMDPQQKMMNGMMQFMPIYIVFISAGFPAGTVIYWAFSSLFGAVQQYFITGFGSLPDLPGLGFLPRKPLTPPPPPPAPPVLDGAPRKQGIMGRMMDKALEAQEAQKAAQAAEGTTTALSTEEPDVRPKGTGKGSQPQAKPVPSTTLKYASDLRNRSSSSGNGTGNGVAAEVTKLPRKKKSKK